MGYDRSVLGFPSFPIPQNAKVYEHAGAPTDLVETIMTMMQIPECGLLLGSTQSGRYRAYGRFRRSAENGRRVSSACRDLYVTISG